MSVPVYSPYGRKEVVQTDGRCLNGILSSPSCASLKFDSEVQSTLRASVWVNFWLLIAKMYAWVSSGSLAVLASLVDSAIDLLGQGTLVWASYVASRRKNDDEYPVGRGRLESVGIMICSVVMGMASIEVISTSGVRLLKYWGSPNPPSVTLSEGTMVLLIGIIQLKGLLYIWCRRVVERTQNDAVKAIMQDNANDVLSNLAALLAPEATLLSPQFWVVDPIAGIVMSIYIVYVWLVTGKEQVERIVGKIADTDFLRKVMTIANEHHTSMQLDQLNAYHFGPKYLVEVEVVMPESTALRESHDAGIALQHKIEMLEEVERCFVHIDYQLRPKDDHDPKVPIEEKLYGGPCRDSPRASHSHSGRLDKILDKVEETA